MANRLAKGREAVLTAERDNGFQEQFPKWRKMLLPKLYLALEVRGYWWDRVNQVWQIQQVITARGEHAPKSIARWGGNLSNVFLVRIMAPSTEIDKIHAELMELGEALGWQIEAAPREYPNQPDGAWIRRYYTVKRG